MPSVRAASSALCRSREAIAVTSLHTPFCMPGMTFVRAIFAVLRIPQRTLDIARHHSRKGVAEKGARFRSRLYGPKPVSRAQRKAIDGLPASPLPARGIDLFGQYCRHPRRWRRQSPSRSSSSRGWVTTTGGNSMPRNVPRKSERHGTDRAPW